MADTQRTEPVDATIEQLVEEFAAGLAGGEQPQLRHYLSRGAGHDRAELARRLVRLELEHRQRSEHLAAVEVEVQRLPEFEQIVRQVYEDLLMADTHLYPTHMGDTSVVNSQGRVRHFPEKIGRYRIIDYLGSGAQADVYRGLHPTLGCDVVIKKAKRSIRESVATAELLDEGRVLAQLNHPNLARVYDLEFEEEHPYLVLEYLSGTTLATYADSHRIPAEEAAGIVARMADALACAHARGITHRDLKPQNVVMDSDGEPRVIDFGLARVNNVWTQDSPIESGVTGTLAYMAPEQAQGDLSLIDARTDLFGLGGVLYRLLTGTAPLTGTTIQEILDRARRCEIDLARLDDAEIPPRIAAICRKCLEPDPSDRFSTAAELRDALGQSTGSRRPLVAVGAILACLVLAGIFGIPALMDQRTAPSDDAAQALKQVPTDPPTADSVSSNLRILAEVQHGVVDGEFTEFEGPLDTATRMPQVGDFVRLQASFSRPAYCYLIAFNPDGTEQLCLPETAQERPEPLEKLLFPTDPTSVFRLTDGAGQQVFVLIASDVELPAYADFRRRNSLPDWSSRGEHGSWLFDEDQVRPASDRRERGTIKPRQGVAGFRGLCEQIVAADFGTGESRPQVWACSFPVQASPDDSSTSGD